MKKKLPKHLRVLINTPAKRKRGEMMMAEGRIQQLKQEIRKYGPELKKIKSSLIAIEKGSRVGTSYSAQKVLEKAGYIEKRYRKELMIEGRGYAKIPYYSLTAKGKGLLGKIRRSRL